jgi:hypothetical protein
MSAGWVAGSVRSQAMAHRRLGAPAARRLATAGSVAEALGELARSAYDRSAYDRSGRPTDPAGGGAAAADRVATAQRGVAETLLWNLRVLAGWLPAAGAEQLRRLAGWFEIANVDEHLRSLAGRPAEPPFRLGTLATAWPRLARTGSAGELREVLAASPWGDPGGSGDWEISLGMRLAWADRVATRVPAARPWAAGAVALLVARERFAAPQEGAPDPAWAGSGAPSWVSGASRLLGPGWMGAGSLAELARAVPAAARWALATVTEPADLWEAELRWWRRLAADGARLLAGHDPGGLGAGSGGGFGPGRMVGAVAVLAADAWLVRGALELAGRGGTGAAEVFDALA